MRTKLRIVAALCAAALTLPLPAGPAGADGFELRREALSISRPVRDWMNPEIGEAWRQGFTGQGATVTVVDDFRSGSRSRGALGTTPRALHHGQWTRSQARLTAPGARTRAHHIQSGRRVALRPGLNVINLSYGMFASAGHKASRIGWSRQETSIINHAQSGRAIVAKAAGNDGIAVGAARARGGQDYLNTALIGAPSAIFVGALARHGTPGSPAALAGYSNVAGKDARVQNQFLVVGVEGRRTGLHGTSYAAPIVSGYAAVLGSKFRGATAAQIASRLLSTARTDTISGFDAAIHGRGEASIGRALAPRSIR